VMLRSGGQRNTRSGIFMSGALGFRILMDVSVAEVAGKGG
jgi:hypothetical protein